MLSDGVSREFSRLTIGRSLRGGLRPVGTSDKANSSLPASSPPSAMDLMPLRGWSVEKMDLDGLKMAPSRSDGSGSCGNSESYWPSLGDILESSTHCLANPPLCFHGSSFADRSSYCKMAGSTSPNVESTTPDPGSSSPDCDSDETDGHSSNRRQLHIPAVNLDQPHFSPASSTSSSLSSRTHIRQPSLCQQDFYSIRGSPSTMHAAPRTSARDLNLLFQASHYSKARRLNIMKMDAGNHNATRHPNFRPPNHREINLVLRTSHYSLSKRLLARKKLNENLLRVTEDDRRASYSRDALEHDFIAVSDKLKMSNLTRRSTEKHPNAISNRHRVYQRLPSHRNSMSCLRRISSSAIEPMAGKKSRSRRKRVAKLFCSVLNPKKWEGLRGIWTRASRLVMDRRSSSAPSPDEVDRKYELVQKYLRLSKQTSC